MIQRASSSYCCLPPKSLTRMLPKMRIWATISFWSIVIIPHGLLNEPEWLSHLVKYFKRDLKVSQTVIITDDEVDAETFMIVCTLQKVQLNIRRQVISLRNPTISIAKILKLEQVTQDLQITKLFIVILLVKDNLQNSSFSELMRFLIELSTH